jgi:hypothetical protein
VFEDHEVSTGSGDRFSDKARDLAFGGKYTVKR